MVAIAVACLVVYICVISLVFSENLTYFGWMGFNHTWLRREEGFLTGHRISKFASFITNDNLATIYDSSANFAFSPGVDGDYSFPSLNYIPIIYESSNQTKDYFTIVARSVTFDWSDNASIPNNETFPISDTILVEPISFELPNSNSIATSILHGFNLTCHCNSSEYSCNSNGIWPYYFEIGIVDANDSNWFEMFSKSKTKTSNDKNKNKNTNSNLYQFGVKVRIARSTNPGSEGKFVKPFNYNMNFKLTIFYSVFVSDNSLDIIDISIPNENNQDETSTIQASDSLWNFRGKKVNFTINGSGNNLYDKYFVGIQRFAFELLGFRTDEFNWPLGRYFEGLSYIIDYGSSSYNAETGVLLGNAMLNVWSALTVYPCNLTYEFDVVMIQVNTNNKYMFIDVLDENFNVSGEICVSGDPHSGDIFFDCKRLDLPDQTRDTVGIAY